MEKIVVEPFQYSIYVFEDKQECIDWILQEKPEAQDIVENVQSSLGTFGKLEVSTTKTKFFLYWGNLSCLDHEIIHATWYLLDYAGVEIDSSNHEIQAYLFEHIKRLVTEKYKSTPEHIKANN